MPINPRAWDRHRHDVQPILPARCFGRLRGCVPVNPNIRLKRAYEPAAPEDGRRILVDRLWPRGLRKEDAAIDRWLKDIAPSTELRRWFGHDPGRWEEFRRRYRSELSARPELLNELRALAREGRLTLVYSARDEHHNDAVVLREMLMR